MKPETIVFLAILATLAVQAITGMGVMQVYKSANPYQAVEAGEPIEFKGEEK